MDWLELKKTMDRDSDLPARAFEIAALTKVLDGEHYDHLRYPFSRENIGDTEEGISIWRRRPSVRLDLCRTVVDQSVSLLFSDDHFPRVLVDNPGTQGAVNALLRERCFSTLMAEIATVGSVGSVAVHFAVLSGKPYFSVRNTAYLTPSWNAEDPDELVQVAECYKASGSELRAAGYDVANDDLLAAFWFEKAWTDAAELWFVPRKVLTDKPEPRLVDERRSVAHGLGFVPFVWTTNLPAVASPRSSGGRPIDGACTFRGGLDTSVRADYSLSSAGRALDFAGAPKLVIYRKPIPNDDGRGSEGGSSTTGLSGGPGRALVLPDYTDAKYLETNAASVAVTEDYAKALRQAMLEAMHGSRADPDRISSAQSGRAMEMLNQPLIWLASKLRKSYGEGCLLPLLRMACRASEIVQRAEGGLLIDGVRYRGLDATGLRLDWPRWYAPTDMDLQAEATTLTTLAEGGIISSETATSLAASSYAIEDVPAERSKILAETLAADARAREISAQVQAKETLPA
jgi:hypothetical protein